jgi:hypothetical protein
MRSKARQSMFAAKLHGHASVLLKIHVARERGDQGRDRFSAPPKSRFLCRLISMLSVDK